MNYTVYADVGQLKVNNNKVKCQIFMKFCAMFDQNPPHTFDKIVEKHITTKLSKLDLEPKSQGHCRNRTTMTMENKKNMPSKNNLSRGT